MKRNKFSLSYFHNTTMNGGQLVPVGLTEVLPGDSFQHSSSALIRCTALLAPVMHPVHVRIHHWFVPTRLVWEDWEDHITGGLDGEDSSVHPTITSATGPGQGTLANYLGIPPKITGFDTNGIEYSAIPFRGFNLIWNNFYRDKDIQTERVVDLGSGPDTTTTLTVPFVNWSKDYFTTARVDPQRGPDVLLPLGTTAPVIPDGTSPSIATASAPSRSLTVRADAAGNDVFVTTGNAVAEGVTGWDNTGMEVDLTGATSVSIIALRESLALQSFAERSMRFGNTYPEYLLSAYGVKSSDARMQWPEYLGGGKQTIQFSEVVQMAPGTATVTGQLRGHGIAALRSNKYRRFFEEHGFVFTLMSIIPKPIYFNGLERHFNRRTRFDYFQREFAHIGQQEVLNKEVYAAAADPDGTFGYQNRYEEYRRSWSRVSADFSETLSSWHFARMFGAEPALNSDFLSAADFPTRPFAVSPATVDAFQCQIQHNIRARRMIGTEATSFIR